MTDGDAWRCIECDRRPGRDVVALADRVGWVCRRCRAGPRPAVARGAG